MKSKPRGMFALKLLVLVATSGLLMSTASAQTTMQKQQAGETESDEQASESGEERAGTDDDADTDSDGPMAPGEEEGYTESQWTQAHIPGVRLDIGFGPDGGAFGLGLGYMYAANWRIQVLATELLFRGGIGPDITVMGGTDEGIRGTNVFGTGRVTATGPRGGITVMAGLGWGVYGAGFVPASRLGLFYATETFEIGYYFQDAFLGDFQPAWMPPHNFGIRLHIPLIEY